MSMLFLIFLKKILFVRNMPRYRRFLAYGDTDISPCPKAILLNRLFLFKSKLQVSPRFCGG